MERTGQYAATPRYSQWIDLSEQHGSVRNRLETSLSNFSRRQPAPVPSIVGAYGSGKSELMAWGFRYCWRELGLPAFVLNAENLLKQLPEAMSPSEFADAVGEFTRSQLLLLTEHLESDGLPQDLFLATDMRPTERPIDYLRELFEDPELSAEAIREMLQKERGALFIDEIEQQYSKLLNRVEANDRAPLREMLQRVGSGQDSYFVVLSFGLTSAYEAISGADARRMDTLTLPIPAPGDLGIFTNLDGYANFIWWVSRGRPGWAAKLANDWGSALPNVQTLERFADLQPRSLENLPLIDVSSLPDALRSQRVNELITQLLKSLGPVSWPNIRFSGERGKDDVIPRNLVLMVQSEKELTPVAELVDCFLEDLIELARKLDVSLTDLAQLRQYLTRVCSAMANEARMVVLGGPRKIELLAKGVIAPVLILTQDFILEFEGDQESTLGILNVLDKVTNHVGIVGDQVLDDYDLLREFPRVEEKFVEARERNLDEATWVSLAPRAIESLFPRLVGRPLLTLLPGAKPTLDEQQAALEAAVKSRARRLHATIQHETTTVEFIFAPTTSCLRTIQEGDFNRNRRRHYLAADRIFVLVDLADEGGFHPIRDVNGDDIRVLEELQKLQTALLPEKRLKDFLTSLWHNILQANLNAEESVSLADALKILYSQAALTKSDRRKLEYYEHRLRQTLESIAVVSVQAFHGQRRRLFSPSQPAFPSKRIEETLGNVRESRAMEQIGLALDLDTDYDMTVSTLAGLRSLELLRKLTKQPNAYNEFLGNYSVTTRPDPGISLKEIYEYVQGQGGFEGLLDFASRLGLQPPVHFESATEAAADAPLLYLYSNLTSTEQAFIKALSFYAYIDSNHSEYVQLLDEVSDDTAKIRNQLKSLQKDVKSLNTELAYDLLDSTEIGAYGAEVGTLMEILGGRDQFAPMLTYVTYRFVDSALEVLQEKMQRWASEQGLEGWRVKLRELRKWTDTFNGLEEEVDGIFVQNPEFKADILGAPKTILSELSRQLKDGADYVFDNLQTGNAVDGAKLASIHMETYTEARDNVRERLNQLLNQADTIDHLIDEMNEIQSIIDRVVGKLGGTQDE